MIIIYSYTGLATSYVVFLSILIKETLLRHPPSRLSGEIKILLTVLSTLYSLAACNTKEVAASILIS